MKYTKILTLALCLVGLTSKAEIVRLFVDNDLPEAKIGVAVQGRSSFALHPDSIIAETMASKHKETFPQSQRDEEGAKELHRKEVPVQFVAEEGYHAVKFFLFKEGRPIIKTLILTEPSDSFLLKITTDESGNPVLSASKFLLGGSY